MVRCIGKSGADSFAKVLHFLETGKENVRKISLVMNFLNEWHGCSTRNDAKKYHILHDLDRIW